MTSFSSIKIIGNQIAVDTATTDQIAEFTSYFLIDAVQAVNEQFSPRQLVKSDRVAEPLPTDSRKLSSYRTRLGSMLEYALCTQIDKAIEAAFGEELRLTFAVAHEYPDFFVRNSTLSRQVRVEMKAVDADSDEQAARFEVLSSLIRPTDIIVLIGWEWCKAFLANGTACEFPKIFAFVVVPANELAAERDHSVVIRGGRVDSDKIMVPKKGAGGKELTPDRGNAGKILRIVHKKRSSEPFALSAHITRYLDFTSAVKGRLKALGNIKKIEDEDEL